MTFMVDRHSFVQLKRSTVVIQHAIRAWISRSRAQIILCHDLSNAAIVIQKCFRGWKARSVYFCKRSSIQDKALTHFQEKELYNLHTHAVFTIQKAWRNFIVGNSLRKQHLAATKIQSCFRRLLMRKLFLEKKNAILKIQIIFQCLRSLREFQRYRKKCRAATTIQSHVRGWIARRRAYTLRSHALIIQVNHLSYVCGVC